MNKLELKQKIVDAALEQLIELHKELNDEAELKLHVAGDIEEGVVAGSFGSGDSGTEDMSKETAFLRKEEAHKVEQVINLFKNYKFEKEHTHIGPLAVAITNRGNFFISKATKDVKIDDVKYHLLGVEAPIYSSLENKQKGDKITFNNLDFQIQDVF